MASKDKNLSEYKPGNIQDAKNLKFAIIVSEWNTEITSALAEGCYESLITHKAKKANITTQYVPGSFELPLAASFFAENGDYDAIICLGCVIQGETRHFEFICEAVANGIMNVNLNFGIPVIFGVLTTNDQQQAIDRAGGKYGNKGVEAAITAIKMAHLKKNTSPIF